jgi:hypothetical protein
MALGDWCVQPIETADGTKLLTETLAVEPVADIAALTGPDGQAFYDESTAFEVFTEVTAPVPLWTGHVDPNQPLPVWMLNQKGKWISGVVVRYGCAGPMPARICLKMKQRIRGGDSGSPVVDAEGHLVGVVSWSGNTDNAGSIPIACRALPAAVIGDIRHAN